MALFLRQQSCAQAHPLGAGSRFRNLCVNLRDYLCDVLKVRLCIIPRFLRARSALLSPTAPRRVPGFLDLAKNYSFLNWKLNIAHYPFPDGHYLDHSLEMTV